MLSATKWSRSISTASLNILTMMDFVFSSASFDAVVARLPNMLAQLLEQPLSTRLTLGIVPTAGVYVFYEPHPTGSPRALYVGRSGTLRERIMQHGRPGSGHNTASFAFLLAAEAMGEAYQNDTRTRRELELAFANDTIEGDDFGDHYIRAKERVSEMQVRFLEVPNDTNQVLFEVYVAMTLKTPYNDFTTS